jgi:hypothetical protein
MPSSSCVIDLSVEPSRIFEAIKCSAHGPAKAHQQHHNHQDSKACSHPCYHLRMSYTIRGLPPRAAIRFPPHYRSPARAPLTSAQCLLYFSLFPIPLPSLHLILVEIAFQPSQWTASLACSLRSCLHARVIMLSFTWYKADVAAPYMQFNYLSTHCMRDSRPILLWVRLAMRRLFVPSRPLA